MRDLGGLGEFEQLVLLAVARLGREATASAVRTEIEAAAKRKVSRGALYATLERLEAKRFLDWDTEEAGPVRGGVPRRKFRVTLAGMESLRRARAAVVALSHGIERLLRGT